MHSAKGSTWKNHKYIKKVDGVYFYKDESKKNMHGSGSTPISAYAHAEANKLWFDPNSLYNKYAKNYDFAMDRMVPSKLAEQKLAEAIVKYGGSGMPSSDAYKNRKQKHQIMDREIALAKERRNARLMGY